jgi:outer membrane protein
MTRHHVLASTLLLLAAASPASAAGTTVRSMSLRDALAYARLHQPAVHAALARLAAARADRRISRAEWYPVAVGTLQVIGGTANNTSASYIAAPGLDIPRVGATRFTASGSFAPQASTFAALGATQEVFDFGRIAAQTAVDDALVRVQRHASDVEELRVAFGVQEAYYAVQAAHAALKTAVEAYQRSLVHRNFARANVTSGLRPRIELTRAEADLTRFAVGRIRAQGALVASRSAFAAATGVPELELDVQGEPPSLAALPTLAAALARAARRDPVLLQAAALLTAQRSTTRAIGAQLRPDLALTASFSGREGGASPDTGETPRFDGWLPDVPNWNVGLVLRWRLYDRTILARRDASRQREEVRRAEVDTARQEQVAGIKQAHVRVQVAQSALAALEQALEAARANHAQAEARFRGGLGTGVELADAEAVRVDAEMQLIVGRFELARARALLGRLIAEGL